ncbi:MAG: hypothetical protein OS130_07185 [Thermodesulfobacteriota bacterium]|jgi:hypothetical protein|nr:MAG: hypothetical protein OS130_07185 [Thermodesulfobacteriota bacterium]
MKINEIERRKYLALQAFYLETKRAMEVLEKKLKAKPIELKHVEVLECQEKVNASTC